MGMSGNPRFAAICAAALLLAAVLAWYLGRTNFAVIDGSNAPVAVAPKPPPKPPAPGPPRAAPSLPAAVPNPEPKPTPAAAVVAPAAVPGAVPPASAPAMSAASAPPPAPVPDAFDAATVAIDLDQVGLMLRDYRTRMGENPVGTNAEIMKSVMGGNPKGAILGPPEGQNLNGKGELVDQWGTPYFFHQMSATDMQISSAGPDRMLGTEDDIRMK